ncbi:hypothetical protein FHS51_001717 [Sphingobium wenxiniae]|nr:hypothetical protein [Sphingobium wenxiniae]MBB6191490.1 hypothetical protein [Sphingobium wenxiniae]
MSSALRATFTLREARALQRLVQAGAAALNHLAPDQSDEIIAMLDIGIHDVATKQADARARKKVKEQRPVFPPMINIDIDGYAISAELGDWVDISTDPDYSVWGAVTPEREAGQHEIRRNAWRVHVLNPDRYGPLHLAYGCTAADSRDEVEELATKLVDGIRRERRAA